METPWDMEQGGKTMLASLTRPVPLAPFGLFAVRSRGDGVFFSPVVWIGRVVFCVREYNVVEFSRWPLCWMKRESSRDELPVEACKDPTSIPKPNLAEHLLPLQHAQSQISQENKQSKAEKAPNRKPKVTQNQKFKFDATRRKNAR